MNDNVNDKYESAEIHVKNKFLEKLDNFWFYYKTHVLVALFVVLVLTVCIAQSCSREADDVLVLYAGPTSFTAEAFEQVKNEVSSAVTVDYNGDGEKRAGVVAYNVMSKEQILEKQKELETTLNQSYYSEQYQIYSQYITSGECAVFLLDPWLYDTIVSQKVNILRPLSEVLAVVPEYAVGEYGIKFSETSLYKNSKYLSQLPEDTILCLSKPLVLSNGSGNKANYSNMVDMFVSMAQG